MSITSIWKSAPDQFTNKHVNQIIKFIGDGILRDGNITSEEFKEYLSNIPSYKLKDYTNDCLNEPFVDSGLALQDIVNEIGRRLGFSVTSGLYRSNKKDISYDGLWTSKDGDNIIIEVKTTDAYRFPLDRIADYRRSLISSNHLQENNSSILIVVGRKDTGDLEAQIRGSKHAWDIRLISIDALIRLMELKETVEDPVIIRKICQILLPREYTRVDSIIDLVFSTTEDVTDDGANTEIEDQNSTETIRENPVNFASACINRFENIFNLSLIKRTRSTFSTSDEKTAVTCNISREYDRSEGVLYWFAFHPHQKEYLESTEEAWLIYGCGSSDQVIAIPYKVFSVWLSDFNMTHERNRYYWHIHIRKTPSGFQIIKNKGQDPVDISKFLL